MIALVGIGALINKNTFEGRLIRKGALIGIKEGAKSNRYGIPFLPAFHSPHPRLESLFTGYSRMDHPARREQVNITPKNHPPLEPGKYELCAVYN